MSITNKLESLAHIAAFLALILSAANFYMNYLSGPNLEIQKFPSEYDATLYQYNAKDPITFSFFIHNSGTETAFIKYKFVHLIGNSGKELYYSGARLDIDKDYIDPKETIKATVHLPEPGIKQIVEFNVEIVYDPGFKRIVTDSLPAEWR